MLILSNHHDFVIYIPSQTALIPSTQLANVYPKARGAWLLFISVKVSFANVENVVNPPQNPVINRNRKLLDGIRLTNNPIQKHPNIFTINVATGKGKGSDLTMKTEVRNRNMLPTAPPAPTNRICLTMFQIYRNIL